MLHLILPLYNAKLSGFRIVIFERLRLLMINAQAVKHRVRMVVLALHKLAAALVADASSSGCLCSK